MQADKVAFSQILGMKKSSIRLILKIKYIVNVQFCGNVKSSKDIATLGHNKWREEDTVEYKNTVESEKSNLCWSGCSLSPAGFLGTV